MGQLDALRVVDHVRDRLVNLAMSENYLRDREVAKACRAVWAASGNEGGLVSELWVEGAFPTDSSEDSLGSLAAEERFSKPLCEHLDNNASFHLDGKPSFPRDRKLHAHQSKAIRNSVDSFDGDRPAFVITAGTGTGKTEAFLL